MKGNYIVTSETIVDEMTQRYPVTAVVLMKMGVQCVGCWISPHHTVADMAKEWRLNLNRLLKQLNEFVQQEGNQAQE